MRAWGLALARRLACWFRAGQGGEEERSAVTLGEVSELYRRLYGQPAGRADVFRLGTWTYTSEATHDHGTDDSWSGRRGPAIRPAFKIAASLGRHR